MAVDFLVLGTVLAGLAIGTYGLLFLAAVLANGMLAESEKGALAGGVITAVLALPIGCIVWYASPSLAAQGPPTYALDWDGSNVITPLMNWPLIVTFITGDIHSWNWLLQWTTPETALDLLRPAAALGVGVFFACHVLVYFLGLPRLCRFANRNIASLLSSHSGHRNREDGQLVELEPRTSAAEPQVQQPTSQNVVEGACSPETPVSPETNVPSARPENSA